MAAAGAAGTGCCSAVPRGSRAAPRSAEPNPNGWLTRWLAVPTGATAGWRCMPRAAASSAAVQHLADAGGRAQLADGLGLNLADALARDLEQRRGAGVEAAGQQGVDWVAQEGRLEGGGDSRIEEEQKAGGLEAGSKEGVGRLQVAPGRWARGRDSNCSLAWVCCGRGPTRLLGGQVPSSLCISRQRATALHQRLRGEQPNPAVPPPQTPHKPSLKFNVQGLAGLLQRLVTIQLPTHPTRDRPLNKQNGAAQPLTLEGLADLLQRLVPTQLPN